MSAASPGRIRIVSGGQTGADRGALDAALALDLEIGGWVPRGRLAEDGVIPPEYPNLREADSPEPARRTALNVRDSDATVIISHGTLVGGTALTDTLARESGKPLLHLDLDRLPERKASAELRDWLARVRPRTLNVAGARESEDPAIHDAVERVLLATFGAGPAPDLYD